LPAGRLRPGTHSDTAADARTHQNTEISFILGKQGEDSAENKKKIGDLHKFRVGMNLA
jgi:hypothetical protein